MDVFEAIQERRSIRSYQDKPVEREKLEIILEAGRLAPSAKNVEPWHFIAVTDAEKLKALSGGTWAKFLTQSQPSFLKPFFEKWVMRGILEKELLKTNGGIPKGCFSFGLCDTQKAIALWFFDGIKVKPSKKNQPIDSLYRLQTTSLRRKNPSEAFGIQIEGKNKWITLIRNASIKPINQKL